MVPECQCHRLDVNIEVLVALLGLKGADEVFDVVMSVFPTRRCLSAVELWLRNCSSGTRRPG